MVDGVAVKRDKTGGKIENDAKGDKISDGYS